MPLTNPTLLTPFLTGPAVGVAGLGGKLILQDVMVTIDGIDASGYCRQVELQQETEEVDLTHFGNIPSGYREYDTGQREVRYQFEFYVGNPTLDTQLRTLHTNGQTILVSLAAWRSRAVSTTNPAFDTECVLNRLTSLEGALGEPVVTTAEFKNTAGMTIRTG